MYFVVLWINWWSSTEMFHVKIRFWFGSQFQQTTQTKQNKTKQNKTKQNKKQNKNRMQSLFRRSLMLTSNSASTSATSSIFTHTNSLNLSVSTLSRVGVSHHQQLHSLRYVPSSSPSASASAPASSSQSRQLVISRPTTNNNIHNRTGHRSFTTTSIRSNLRAQSAFSHGQKVINPVRAKFPQNKNNHTNMTQAAWALFQVSTYKCWIDLWRLHRLISSIRCFTRSFWYGVFVVVAINHSNFLQLLVAKRFDLIWF